MKLNLLFKNLGKNKACGLDNVLNEHIKTSMPIMKHVYAKLFNVVFKSGIVPSNWKIGVLNPIYKNKGSPSYPANYRPITLLSCVGKLFTSVLNYRLQKYCEMYDMIDQCQTGFRKGFSTIDNMFVLQCIFDIYRNQKKRIYCAFIDLKRAFDTMNRPMLWSKLMSYNINDKFLDIVKSMFNQAKSRVSVNRSNSGYFPCSIGVRQGANLSPLLFTCFLNDLNDYFRSSTNLQGVNCASHPLDNQMFLFLKVFVLLYADDTVIVSKTAGYLQNALDNYEQYCKMWKLTVNTS